MAELVGDAYIRITADTAGMRSQMSRAMKNAGKDDANNYIRTFSNEVEDTADAKLRGARTALAKAMVDPKEFDRLAKNFGSIEKAAESWRLELRQLSREHRIATGDYSKFTAAINEWEAASIAAKKATEDESEALWQASRARAAYARDFKSASLLREHHLRAMRGERIELTDHLNPVLDRTAVLFGRAFGKGSRNNFLNLVGSIVGGVASIGAAIGKFAVFGIEKLINLFGGGGGGGGIASAGKAAAGGMEAAAAAAPQLAAAFAGPQGLVVAAVGAGLALVAFGEILPGLVSLIGLLAGVVVALAGSITFALTGALLAVVPALAGLVAGFGAVGAAFLSFFGDKKKKQLVKDFVQPFKDFGKQFHGQVETFLGGFKGGLKGILDDLTPSVNAFFASWKTNMTDRQTERGLGRLSDGIGRIATTFNTALPRLFSGLVGFFQPIMPFAERLASAIGNAFASFDDWANDKKGQQSISTFMYKAWDSATKVWGILKEIGAIIWTVFDSGQDTGDSFLDSILTKLTEIRTFLQSPEGKAKMKEWFGNVEEIGKNIGEIASAIGRMITSLSSPEGQANAKAFMDAIVGVANVAATIFGLANDIDRITKAVFASRSKPAPQKVPSLNETPEQTRARVEKSMVNREVEISMDVNDKFAKEKIQAIENYVSTGVTIPIKGNEELWEASKGKAEQWVFTPKQIPVDGNTTAWDRDKGTIDAFVFDTKSITIKANAAPAEAAIQKVKDWLATLPASKTIRIAGVNSVGGVTMAAGGIVNGATPAIIGEAGREAVVPLDRSLSQVDPAVRSLSAIAQQMTGGRGASTAATLGPKVNFEAGAFAVNLPTGDPALAAEAVLDRLVAYIR